VRHILIILSLFLFSLTVISCRNSSKTATTDNETTNNELIGNNNNSILSGSRIGNGEDYNSDLSKSVRISVKNSGVFSYKTPYCGRYSSSSGSFKCIIPIINLSKDPRCWISMRSIKYYDSSNNILDDGFLDFSYVQGSIGVIKYGSGNMNLSSCLTFGETGYVSHGLIAGINGSGWTLYTDLYKIVVSEIESSSSESIKISDPSIQIKPLSYSTSGTYKSPTIRVKNSSEINIVTTVSKMFLLDSYNNPIYEWSIYPQGSGSTSSNSYKYFKPNNFFYDGSRYKILVFINVKN
jgi:hypothetical protein